MGVPAACREGRPSLITPSPWEGREERAGRACGGLHELGVRALSSGGVAIEKTLSVGEPAPAIDPVLAGPGPLTPAKPGERGARVVSLPSGKKVQGLKLRRELLGKSPLFFRLREKALTPNAPSDPKRPFNRLRSAFVSPRSA